MKNYAERNTPSQQASVAATSSYIEVASVVGSRSLSCKISSSFALHDLMRVDQENGLCVSEGFLSFIYVSSWRWLRLTRGSFYSYLKEVCHPFTLFNYFKNLSS